MKKKTLCFDLDNVICTTYKNHYTKSKPKKKIVKLINQLYDQGFIIKILTARYPGRFNDYFSKVKKKGFKKTSNQLNKWGLKYHKLFMTKPSFDFYIDDKSYAFNNNWSKYIKKKFLNK